MNQFVAFISFAVAWSLAASLLIGSVNPAVLFAVWLLGFLWGTGYIAAGLREADLLLKRWLQMMAGVAVLAVIGAGLLS
ncbi:hypothetical protein EN858_15035 [Mesorhizobium sp. M4B.F.Ca.ET.215.01.1.1]|uniref:hypothetical protein n=1 Tax=unclassified Mesorhizobium TaxID=325217 RepID=UPI001093C11D|nr:MULTISPECIES: hypothetical protein [unclassified Mesorhizobium]TGQ11234.1 hypothetical protein EN858_15035 [Mesorhizobium sp. M4B.F.Ca.ET.215.01.1.1]TGR04713.1 hypothetical protein EN846_13045 [Mesorhizobium sp. M4B.F.Ca.ET.203.01.1.1]